MDAGPDAFASPALEVIIDRLPRREVGREKPPRAPGPQGIQDRVDELAGGSLARTPARHRIRHERRDHHPLRLSQIGPVASAGSASSRHRRRSRIKPRPHESEPSHAVNPLLKRALSIIEDRLKRSDDRHEGLLAATGEAVAYTLKPILGR